MWSSFFQSMQQSLFLLLLVFLSGISLISSSRLLAIEIDTPHQNNLQPAHQLSTNEESAVRIQNLGSHHFSVSTHNAQAQIMINQGLNLAYAFNHAEAYRAFQEAARLDPSLAMAYWGQALVLGPNINALMEPANEPSALALIQKALSLLDFSSMRERMLILALSKRYTGIPADRIANDQAYAAVMRLVYTQFPEDQDIAMLYVESMMNLRPWNYWMPDGQPYAGTTEIVSITEDVLKSNPKHPGALHLYIHLIEPTNTPQRAEMAADTLLTLMPDAGHMVHMPSHIYQRVGRYADSMRSNQLAIAADENYMVQCHPQGIYPMGYYPHNIHFLWFAATLDGQSQPAIDAARKAASRISDETLITVPAMAIFRVLPYWALTRFGQWQMMLEEPPPPKENAFLTGSWHYARGLAFVATKQIQQAELALESLRGILAMQDPNWDHPLFSPNKARSVLAIGPEVLAGEIAAAKGKFDEAIGYLDRAVRLEDGLIYTEPTEWHSPPRLVLGAILLEAGRPAEAETVYWDDLRRNRNNGWALYGLSQALRAQAKHDLARIIEDRFKLVWERSDLTLYASRLIR